MINIENFQNVYTQQEDDTTGLTTGLDKKIKTQGQAFFLSYILTF